MEAWGLDGGAAGPAPDLRGNSASGVISIVIAMDGRRAK
jgi:hypothetical protein